MKSHSDTQTPFAASAVSGHLDTRTAATEVADHLFDDMGSDTRCDLVLIFGSFHHRSAFDDAAAIVRKTLSPRCMLGVTAESVLGNDRELDGVAGLSAIALRMPGVDIVPWSIDPLISPAADAALNLPARMGLTGRSASDFRAGILFADPFTVPMNRLLGHLRRPEHTSDGTPQDASRHVPLIGGMASGASHPGLNVLIQDDQVTSAGAVGVSLFGAVEIDFIVSQGCRPVGKPLVITKIKDHIILELGGRKAIEVLQEQAQSFTDLERRMLSRGLLIGLVVNEYKARFGRGDFLVRAVLGLDQKVGGIAIADTPRVGQTIQFQVRDAGSAAQDLQLLLDGQALHESPPFAALLFSCNGRGERLFSMPNHDVGIVRERLGEVPLAGFFAAGELGPIGGHTYLHSQTASLAILRSRR